MHTPVMLQEVIETLDITPGKWYLDATLGSGGHTQAILERQGKVIGIDQDPAAINLVKARLKSPNLICVLGNFADIQEIMTKLGLKQVSGILFDLGTSAMQLENVERGFSFMAAAPLDMRMSKTLNVTAADLVNGLSKKELYALFTNFAQEHHARAIADAIVRARKIAPIKTTGQLAGICERAYGGRRGKLHPATKVFQALRIAVNDELGNLERALAQTINILETGGYLVVLSFHEGEDRIVKQFINHDNPGRFRRITKKPITPTADEIFKNHRARSAKLRAVQKIS